MRIGAVLLAAGGSSRLGQPKQLVEIDGEPLIRRAARALLAARGIERVVVVLGAEAGRCAKVLADLPVTLVNNADWPDGLASSLRAGVTATADLPAIVVAVCDQILVTAAHFDLLIAAQQRAGVSVVASVYGAALGVPALFTAKWFASLQSLRGDQGARALFAQAGPGELVTVPLPGGETDVDTPEGLHNARAQLALGRQVRS